MANCNSIDEMWCKFKDIVLSKLNLCAPKVVIKDTSDAPWIDSEVRHMINKKTTAWRKARRTNSDTSWHHFRSIRNLTKSLIKTKRNNFILSLKDVCKTNPKRFWSFFHFKTKSQALPDVISDSERECSAPSDKATLFNCYFGSVFNHDLTTGHPLLDNVDCPEITDPFFTVSQVEECLHDLDVKRAYAPNSIPLVVLKQCRFLLAPPMTLLFNACIQAECIPTEWKKAFVVPIHKKGDKKIVSNYRPISLLCSVSKMLERCIFNQLYPEVESRIHPLQHGFIKGRSCASQLVDVYHRIGATLDKGGQVDMIFLDFSKAFDCISHSLLIYKLQRQFGISGHLLGFIQSYLHERSQCVIVNGESSDWIHVPSGVPQGSILGPLLFLLFINDLPNVSASTTALFADDAKCFRTIVNENDCVSLQQDLDNFYEWSVAWKMNFNPVKCKVLSITRATEPIVFNYSMNNQSLEHVGAFKDLGILVDKNLSFSSHIDNLVGKCNKLCGAIKRAVGFTAPQAVKLALYNTLVRSHLDYASQVWSPHEKNRILKLESVQRAMTRFIVNNDLSYTDRCVVLEILPLSYRREISDLAFIFKYICNCININLDHIIKFNMSNSRSHPGLTATIVTHHPRTETFISSFFNRVCRLWNNLPITIRSSRTTSTFKKKLYLYYRNHLNQYSIFNTCSLTTICRCRGHYHR